MSPYKNGLLVMSTMPKINIGDYIQAVASRQFFDSIDLFLERERLNQYKEDPARLIMNGWFMHEPQNWPPAPAIQPLFVSFHINSISYDLLLSNQSIDYLKQHEPIGCRDINTMELLQSKGVDAYFSACLTLTLGYKYKNEQKSKQCYFVDPYMPASRVNLSWIAKMCWLSLKKYKTIKHLAKSYAQSERNALKRRLKAANFYSFYSPFVSDEIFCHAEFVNHLIHDREFSDKPEREKVDYAETLVKKYAEAALVITSRIHCALPCLALETPVIYIDSETKKQNESHVCRFKGILELFNLILYKDGKFIPQFDWKGKLAFNNIPSNKTLYKTYAERLFDKCTSFCSRQS